MSLGARKLYGVRSVDEINLSQHVHQQEVTCFVSHYGPSPGASKLLVLQQGLDEVMHTLLGQPKLAVCRNDCFLF
jgi:hypothetical protein